MDNIVELLYTSAANYPQQLCVASPGRKVTYGQLLAEVKRLMVVLHNDGIRPGDRVILYSKNSAEYIAAFFATTALNAIAVPVNAANNLHLIRYIIDVTTPGLILMDKALHSSFTVGENDKVKVLQDIVNWENDANSLDKNYIINITDTLDNPETPEDTYKPKNDTNNWEEKQPINENEANTPQSQTQTQSKNNSYNTSNTAMIIFTSGTSAMPKGVMLSHGNLLANTCSILDYLHLNHDDSMLVTIAFSYSYGNSLLLTHIAVGGALYLENYAAFPARVIESLHGVKPTGFSTVGSYLNLMLKAASMDKLGLDALKYITFAGEATNYYALQELQKVYPELKIFVMYGQTEASARLSYLPYALLSKKSGSVGKGIANVELKVVNERGEQIAPGETGEIVATGPNVMQGYWQDDEGTKAVIQDGWLHTGDIATVDREGYIYIQGRNNDIIKYLGHRISPMEIESWLDKIPGVFESAVIEGIHNGETCIKAFVVTNGKISVDNIADHLRNVLPPFKRPALIQPIPQIPRTANGKIKRAALREAELCAV